MGGDPIVLLEPAAALAHEIEVLRHLGGDRQLHDHGQSVERLALLAKHRKHLLAHIKRARDVPASAYTRLGKGEPVGGEFGFSALVGCHADRIYRGAARPPASLFGLLIWLFRSHHGSSSPVPACQKRPVVSSVSASMRAITPAAASAGAMPCLPVMSVATMPG